MNEWISVKDRLPPDGKTVLIVYKTVISVDPSQKKRYMATAFFDESNYGYDCWKGWIDTPDDDDATGVEIPLRYVTHWMELPEEPKSEALPLTPAS